MGRISVGFGLLITPDVVGFARPTESTKSMLTAAKVKPGDAAPTLTKNTVKKAATRKKVAKKATGKAK